jgi:hypothetical protein
MQLQFFSCCYVKQETTRMAQINPYIWQAIEFFFETHNLGVRIEYGDFHLSLHKPNDPSDFPYSKIGHTDPIIVVGQKNGQQHIHINAPQLTGFTPTKVNGFSELYVTYTKESLASTFATISAKISEEQRNKGASLQFYPLNEYKAEIIPSIIYAFGLSANWIKNDKFEISAGPDVYKQFTAIKTGGGKPNGAKWTRTSRKVDVKHVTKTVYRNSKTGELRVRKLVARPDGSRRVSYVKF